MLHLIYLLSAWLRSVVTVGVINGGIKCTLDLWYLGQNYSKCYILVKKTLKMNYAVFDESDSWPKPVTVFIWQSRTKNVKVFP